MTDLIDETPHIQRHSVGDCEMLPRPNGAWLEVSEVRTLVNWVLDNDDRDTMLAKLEYIKRELP